MIPLSCAEQIVKCSFEHALNEIVEEHLELSVFDDQTGSGEKWLRHPYEAARLRTR